MTKHFDIVKQIPKKPETAPPFNPYKGHEYRLFLVWSNIPVLLKTGNRANLEAMGVDDEELLVLSECKTLGDFADKFGVSRDTLTEWKTKPVPVEFEKIDWRAWAKQLTKNVVNYLYEGIRVDKDAARIKLWLQAVDGYVEESSVNTNLATSTLEGVRDIVTTLNKAKEQPAHEPEPASEDDERSNSDSQQ